MRERFKPEFFQNGHKGATRIATAIEIPTFSSDL